MSCQLLLCKFPYRIKFPVASPWFGHFLLHVFLQYPPADSLGSSHPRAAYATHCHQPHLPQRSLSCMPFSCSTIFSDSVACMTKYQNPTKQFTSARKQILLEIYFANKTWLPFPIFSLSSQNLVHC